MAPLFSKKMSNIKNMYISNVFVNKLHTNLKQALAKFYRLYYFLGMRNYPARP